MATNYTTKTAALKATLADIRQVAVGKKIEVGSGETNTQITKDSVSAEDLYISVEGKEQRQSVKSLIQQAQNDATAAAGIQVGNSDNSTTGVDTDSDGTFDTVTGGLQKAKGMNFCGNVAVVPNGDGTVDLWFMTPNNEKGPSAITETLGTKRAMYVYDGAGDTLGIGDGASHANCRKTTETYTDTYKISGASGDIMSSENKIGKIKVEITNGDSSTVLESFESNAICEASVTTKLSGATTNRGGSFTNTSTSGAIKIAVTNVIDNKVDNKAGINDTLDSKTPGYVRFKATVTTCPQKIASIASNGGTAKVKVYFNDTELTGTSSIVYYYIDKGGTNSPLASTDIGTPTLSYVPGTVNTISGLKYDSSAVIRVDVADIKNTQLGGAHSKAQTARAYCSDVSEPTNIKNVDSLAGTLTTKYESGTKVGANAVFSGSREATCQCNSAKIVKINLTGGTTVQVYDQAGTASTKAQASASVPTITTWLCKTASTADSDSYTIDGSNNLKVTFTRDNKRVLADYNTLMTNKAVPAIDSYSNTALLSTTAYSNQLMVQDNYLAQPKYDLTQTYTSLTGRRAFVVPFSANTAKTQFTVKATGLGSSFNNGEVRIFIVCKNNSGVWGSQCLNAYGATENTSFKQTYNANAIATDSKPTSDSWSVALSTGTFSFANEGNYWLVVDMEDTCDTKLTSIEIIKK